MDFGLQNIEDYTKDLAWVLKAVEQLEKEFQSEKWTFRKPLHPETAFKDIVLQLQPSLKALIDRTGHDYCKQLLYKIDISERQIAKAVALESDLDFSEVLAKLILRRCLQKVLIKNYYKICEKDTPDKGLEQ
ncbi:MAG: hypothetical protein NZ604_00420 [Flavobacteriales bacterium]|nr:hypothetical protein [Flavobacteriales bacterium]